MTEERFGITLLFAKVQSYHLNYLQLSGITLINSSDHGKKIPYENIQLFKNDKIKAEYSIPLIEKSNLKILLFPNTPIILYENDKIGIKLV